MNKFLLITSGLILASFGPCLRAQDTIDAEALLREVRKRTAQNEELTLKGQLREGRKKHPFRMTVRKTQIAYLFEEKPPHTLVLDLGADRFRLRENAGGDAAFTDVSPENYGNTLRDTGVNYLDISLAYLYWPDPVYLRNDVVSERITLVVEVRNPDPKGPYAKILLWIDEATGGLMRMDGLDTGGKLVKQMKVTEVQRVKRGDEKFWAPEKLVISTFDPKSGRRLALTYMEMDK